MPTFGAPLPPRVPRLIQILEGGYIGASITLDHQLTVGCQNAGFTLEDVSLSPTHFRLEQRDEKFYLRDLGSTSGTFIRIHDAVELVDGDLFKVGRTRLRITCR